MEALDYTETTVQWVVNDSESDSESETEED